MSAEKYLYFRKATTAATDDDEVTGSTVYPLRMMFKEIMLTLLLWLLLLTIIKKLSWKPFLMSSVSESKQ